jgi:hypothetical protein
MKDFIRPMLLSWEEPCSRTNQCWISDTFYGSYYISNEDGKFHTGIDYSNTYWESFDHLCLTDAKFACYDKHIELIKTCYDDFAYFTYFNEAKNGKR